MFKKKNKQLTDTDGLKIGHDESNLDSEVKPTATVNQSKPKKKNKKSVLNNLKKTSWSVIHEEILAGDYKAKVGDDIIGLAITKDILALGDKDTGPFIHHVNKGTIKAHITYDMIDDDYFVLLLDDETIEHVKEYSFLWDDASLERVTLDAEGVVTKSGAYCRLPDIGTVISVLAVNGNNKEVVSSDTTVVPNVVEIVESIPKVENIEDTQSIDVSNDLLFEAGSVDIDSDVVGDDYQEDFYNMTSDDSHINEGYSNDFDDPDEDMEFSEDFEESYEGEYEDNYTQEDGYVDMSRDTVESVVHRIFAKGDLDLLIETTLFDEQFSEDTFVPFIAPDGDSELDMVASRMANESNQKMHHIIRTNRALLRDNFLQRMGRVCTGVLDQTDINNPNTLIGGDFVRLEDTRSQMINALPSQITEYQAKLDVDWSKELEEHGNAAKNNAIASYKHRHGLRHENKRAAVRDELERTIHKKFEYGASELNAKRQSAALRLMDAGTDFTLKQVSQMYIAQLKEEAEHREKLANEMEVYFRENYQNELARVRVLEQEMLNKTEAQRVQEECEARIERIKTEFNASHVKFDADRKQFIADLELKDIQYKEFAAKAEEKYADFEKALVEQRKAFELMDEKNDLKYRRQLEVYENTVDSYKLQVEIHDAELKRKSKINIAVVIGVAIGMLAVGALIGMLVGTYLRLW